MPTRIGKVVALALTLLPAAATAAEHRSDVVIYGATSAGITAAIAAADEGASVALLSPKRHHIGGATTGGLGWTDHGVRAAIGGLARRFYERVHDHYQRPEAWESETLEEYLQRGGRRRMGERAMWAFEPHVAERLLRDMLEAGDAELRMNQRLVGADVSDGRIRTIRTQRGDRFRGRVFLDTSYEGDLLAAAGVRYTSGREPRRRYDEPLAGVLDPGAGRFRQPKQFFGEKVSPYVEPGEPDSGLLPGIQGRGLAEPGTGDQKIQAYNFRACLTTASDNRIPITKPEGYDPQRYELLARFIETHEVSFAGRMPRLLLVNPIPNGKTDINDGCAFSTDYIGANWQYPDGDHATRQRIIADHERFTKGLFYFLGHDPRVPQRFRRKMQRYGYPEDEYADIGHWSHQLYIREARRMIGRYVMTQHDTETDRAKRDAIGMGSYAVDSHHIQRVAVGGEVVNEGNFFVHRKRPYQIPYRCLTPKRADCRNLLVPVCVSASHVGFGSMRMEPVFMIMGESAGVAAATAVRDDTPVQEVPIDALQRRLRARDQVLALDRAREERR